MFGSQYLAEDSNKQSGCHESEKNADKARDYIASRHDRMFHDWPLLSHPFGSVRNLLCDPDEPSVIEAYREEIWSLLAIFARPVRRDSFITRH